MSTLTAETVGSLGYPQKDSQPILPALIDHYKGKIINNPFRNMGGEISHVAQVAQDQKLSPIETLQFAANYAWNPARGEAMVAVAGVALRWGPRLLAVADKIGHSIHIGHSSPTPEQPNHENHLQVGPPQDTIDRLQEQACQYSVHDNPNAQGYQIARDSSGHPIYSVHTVINQDTRIVDPKTSTVKASGTTTVFVGEQQSVSTFDCGTRGYKSGVLPTVENSLPVEIVVSSAQPVEAQPIEQIPAQPITQIEPTATQGPLPTPTRRPGCQDPVILQLDPTGINTADGIDPNERMIIKQRLNTGIQETCLRSPLKDYALDYMIDHDIDGDGNPLTQYLDTTTIRNAEGEFLVISEDMLGNQMTFKDFQKNNPDARREDFENATELYDTTGIRDLIKYGIYAIPVILTGSAIAGLARWRRRVIENYDHWQ